MISLQYLYNLLYRKTNPIFSYIFPYIDDSRLGNVTITQTNFSIIWILCIIIIIHFFIPKNHSYKYINQFLKGKKIGSLQVDRNTLNRLKSDLIYVQTHLKYWKRKSHEEKQIIYLTQYRFIEGLLREIANFIEGKIDPNRKVFACLCLLEHHNLVRSKDLQELHNYRRYRNNLQHKAGTIFSPRTALSSIHKSIIPLNQLLKTIKSLS